jgi:hypothetical protein
MTGSEDHRGSRRLADLSEVSHARTAIITDCSLSQAVASGGEIEIRIDVHGTSYSRRTNSRIADLAVPPPLGARLHLGAHL